MCESQEGRIKYFILEPLAKKERKITELIHVLKEHMIKYCITSSYMYIEGYLREQKIHAQNEAMC